MKRCPITYEVISNNEMYSKRGLHLLSPQLKNLQPLNYDAEEQRQEAIQRVGKMSVQGVQLKLSAQLKVKAECFALVDQGGHYILKPQSDHFKELPENEALTMSLAALINIEVPVHGLVYSKDGSFTYFIKRFDRSGHRRKIPVEDFAQLSGAGRDSKYESSMEKIVSVIQQFCSFPKIEMAKLFKLTLFNFLIGNEDMHLKNFSLITREGITTIAPAYDLVNSTIVMKAKEEMALPLNGKKNNLTRKDLIQYFAEDRLGLNHEVVKKILDEIESVLPVWHEWIGNSFLSSAMQEKYRALLDARWARLQSVN